MPGFLFRLNAPRPTFPGDMTEAELATMLEHVAYWTDLAAQGIAVAFGPVADPAGSWGVGIILADDLAQAQALEAADPVSLSDHGFHTDIFPMPSLVTAAGRFDASPRSDRP